MKYVTYISVIAFVIYLFLGNGYEAVGGIAIACFIISVIWRVVAWIIRRSQQPTKTNAPNFTITVKSDADMEFYCRIAGVQYHCTAAEVGGFLGYVAPETNNPHDKNACAVYRNDDKLVGYIPKDKLTEYRQWSGCKSLPCVGFVKEGADVPLFGKVKVINNADETEAKIIIVKYVRWLVANFGKKYVPVGFNVDTEMPLKTKSDWLAALDEYIESNDE